MLCATAMPSSSTKTATRRVGINMTRLGLRYFCIFSFIVLGILPYSQVTAAKTKTAILPPPIQVSEHVYAWIGPHGGASVKNQGYRMNLAFVVGKDAVAVIETGYTEAMAQEMLQHIARITSKPVKYAINSNSQPDRFLGNEVFRRRGALIVAQHAEAQRMADMGGMFAAAAERALALPPGSARIPNAPDNILSADTSLDLGGVTLNLRHFGAAHTPGPLVVHIPQDKIVYAGDVLYSGRLPAIVAGGNIKSWIAVFEKLREFGDVRFVPGHGKPAPLADFEFPTLEYLKLLHTHMTKMVEDGKDAQDAMASLDQSRWAKLANYQDLAGRNASLAYLEAEAASF